MSNHHLTIYHNLTNYKPNLTNFNQISTQFHHFCRENVNFDQFQPDSGSISINVTNSNRISTQFNNFSRENVNFRPISIQIWLDLNSFDLFQAKFDHFKSNLTISGVKISIFDQFCPENVKLTNSNWILVRFWLA